MRQCKNVLLLAGLSAAFLFAALQLAIQSHAATTPKISRAVFESDGAARLPSAYRQWVHVGTRVKVGGRNILDGVALIAPQVLNTFVEPSAMTWFVRTGAWPEGTQMVKEISVIRTGTGCDAATNICTNELGTGLFEDTYSGLGLMVKDSRRFPSIPGHWGYFAFFHKGTAWDPLAKVRTREQCSTCHEKLSPDTDYVITKAHLGLTPANFR